jgi:hypothetical protein
MSLPTEMMNRILRFNIHNDAELIKLYNKRKMIQDYLSKFRESDLLLQDVEGYGDDDYHPHIEEFKVECYNDTTKVTILFNHYWLFIDAWRTDLDFLIIDNNLSDDKDDGTRDFRMKQYQLSRINAKRIASELSNNVLTYLQKKEIGKIDIKIEYEEIFDRNGDHYESMEECDKFEDEYYRQFLISGIFIMNPEKQDDLDDKLFKDNKGVIQVLN